MKVPFFDRTRVDAAIEPELTEAFLRVVRSGRYVLGPEVEAFEREIAGHVKVAHAVGVSSGSDALLCALLAVGVGPGDEVICPAFSFVASAEAIVRAGAKPVFVDIDNQLTLIEDDVPHLVTPRTKAILVVHLFGTAARMGTILEVAAARHIAVVEDAAQNFGMRPQGAAGCYSFFPTKTLGGFGDGGMVVTDDAAIAARVRSLRSHGAREKHVYERIGGNFRLDELQAALLRVRFEHVRDLSLEGALASAHYGALFTGMSDHFELPQERRAKVANPYVICIHNPKNRDLLRAYLTERDIGTEVYYPLALHQQPCFASGRPRRALYAEHVARSALALPFFPGITEEEQQTVTRAVRQYFGERPDHVTNDS